MPRVFVPKERGPSETRVAATPETVKKLVKAGLEVAVEPGAGEAAHLPDAFYQQAGATLAEDPRAACASAEVVLRVGPPEVGSEVGEVGALAEGALLIGLLDPFERPEMVERLAAGRVSALAMELLPRTTRAQSMDALSSQASVAGYKAVLLAAWQLGRYFPLLMTAAGTIPPTRVVVVGAGVAGLQALATARRLGAVVEVSDIRAEVAEQVASLGGRFIDLPMAESGAGGGGYARQMSEEFLTRQREILKRHVAAADVVITTAAVPGKKAPRLLSADMVEAMRPGSVVVDLAAERGGNCELTRPGEEVDHRGVLVMGPLNLPAAMPLDASTLYSRNVLALLLHVLEEGKPRLDLEDEIVAGALLTHDGQVVHPALVGKPEVAKT